MRVVFHVPVFARRIVGVGLEEGRGARAQSPVGEDLDPVAEQRWRGWIGWLRFGSS